MRENYKAAWIEYLRDVLADLESGKADLLKAGTDFEICEENTSAGRKAIRTGEEYLMLKLYRPEMDRR